VETGARPHAPLVPLYLAACRRIFGEAVVATRAAMLCLAALALVGLFRLAERAANRAVAWASVVCTALYPVFYAESTAAHADMAAAALTIWGLLFYLPPPPSGLSGASMAHDWRRLISAVALFALAVLAKETAALAPLALAAWEVLCRLSVRKFERAAVLCVGPGRRAPRWWPLLLALAPLAVWLASQQLRAGHFSGAAEAVRTVAGPTQDLAGILRAAAVRVWQATGFMSLYVLTIPTLLLTLFARPVRDGEPPDERERGRIEVGVQLVFAVVILAYVLALSLHGGGTAAREMLPAIPLVILVCVSTIWRRTRRWQLYIAAICVVLAYGIFGRVIFL
jgi:hypothetical protein